ncbi:MAG: DUF3313 family protein [Thermodesulfobacteriota bacterium]|nr:DUF3313 family protein [Thermodesulfobacteriota bacterium]
MGIVDIDPSNPALDSLTAIVPVGLAFSLIKQGVTGVGNASMEVMFIDSQSNQVVALGKDKQIGSKLDVAAKTDKWG